jgi:hypothetical protein
MAERTVIGVSACQRIATFSELDGARTCANCICLQSQLSKATEEVKSLQTIISLLQSENERSYADMVRSGCSKT